MKEEKLLSLLQKKRGFFEAILDLTENEESLPMPEWISILEQKKILLSCIEEIDAELAPFKQSLHVISCEISEEIDAIRHVIEKILHLDSYNKNKRKRELQ